jgi:hypothetical protein
MILSLILLLMATLNVFSQARPKVDEPGPVTPSKPQLDADEAQARAWLAERRKEDPSLTQVAEGRHLIILSAEVKEAPASCDIWTLWKSQDGGFEVFGELRFSDCDTENDSSPYWIKLSPRLRPLAFKNFMGDNTAYGCRRTPSEMLCEETGSEGKVLRAIDDDTINDSAELFLPLAFFFAGLTRNLGSQTGESTCFTLYQEDEATETFPISFFARDASLRLLRRGKYAILHDELSASEFRLEVRDPSKRFAHNPQHSVNPPGAEHQQPYSPFYDLWVSENGVLLSASDAKSQKEFIRLVQFKKLADF